MVCSNCMEAAGQGDEGEMCATQQKAPPTGMERSKLCLFEPAWPIVLRGD